jgi:putative nucleotidyltransferase with HDIG domain
MYAAKRRPSGEALSYQGLDAVANLQDLAFRDSGYLFGDSPLGVLEGLVSAVDAKDRYTRDHSEHVARLALLIADELGLSTDQCRIIAVAGLLHDVGKIGVPDRILRKPGALTPEERELVKRHVPFGVAIVRGVLDDTDIVDAVAYHHERWDGKGYPSGVLGPSTPLLSRVMQLADAASSMLLDRPYRKGIDWPDVCQELRANAGSQFDPNLVEILITAYERSRVQIPA